MLARLLSEGFRAFFLLTLLAGLGLMALWLVLLSRDYFALAGLALPIGPAAMHWHGHEMLFGFAGAATAGFLLTAVPNWTAAAPARRGFITLLAALWLAGRGVMLVSGLLPGWLVAAVSLAFWPVLAAQVMVMLMRRPMARNMVFLVLLGGFALAQALVHADWLGLGWGDSGRGLRAGLMLFAAMIAVIGGRIVPAFTRNALARRPASGPPPAEPGRLDALGRLAALATALVLLAPLPDWPAGLAALVAGGLALARLSRWRGRATLGEPILWVLHLSFGFLGLGYLVWGLARLGFGNEVAALHLLAIGAVAGMVLAVLSRASLGHAGRALIAPRALALAYGLMPVSALLRWLSPLAGSLEPFVILAAGVVWLGALGLTLASLAPVLAGPRAGA